MVADEKRPQAKFQKKRKWKLSVINPLKLIFKRKRKKNISFCKRIKIKSLELNKGLISEDRNNKATQPLTIPRSYLSRLQRICSFPHLCNYISRFIKQPTKSRLVARQPDNKDVGF